MLMMSINLNHFAILNTHGLDSCIINGISKSEVMSQLQNANLNEKNGTLSNITFLFLNFGIIVPF